VNYTEFQNTIRVKIEEKLQENYDVSIQNVIKNNDVYLSAVLINEKNTRKATPTIYLEDFYDMYCAGISIDDIINNILAIYRKQLGKVDITFEDFEEFSRVEDKVMIKLINYERNVEGLKQTPHIKMMDLAIVFYILWENDYGQQLSSVVRDSHMSLWNVGMKELYEAAYKNTLERLSVSVRSMKEVIQDIYFNMQDRGDVDPEVEQQYLNDLDEKDYPMYVISNKAKFLGASIIIYDEVLRYMYEKLEGDYYILPSSIHEVIMVSKTDLSEEDMKKMVMEINENEVDYREVLSDNVYKFDGKKLCMV